MGKSAIVLPPTSMTQASPQVPGIRESVSVEPMKTPGIREVRQHTNERPVPQTNQAEPQPERPQAKPLIRSYPVCGNRVPNVGDWVLFWMVDLQQRMVPYPAQLIWYSDVEGRWTLNLHQVGRMSGRHGIAYSDVPADCCWTWFIPREMTKEPTTNGIVHEG